MVFGSLFGKYDFVQFYSESSSHNLLKFNLQQSIKMVPNWFQNEFLVPALRLCGIKNQLLVTLKIYDDRTSKLVRYVIFNKNNFEIWTLSTKFIILIKN